MIYNDDKKIKLAVPFLKERTVLYVDIGVSPYSSYIVSNLEILKERFSDVGHKFVFLPELVGVDPHGNALSEDLINHSTANEYIDVSNYEGIIDLQRKIPALFFKSFINTVCSKGFMNILFNNSSKSKPIIFSCEGDICYFLPS